MGTFKDSLKKWFFLQGSKNPTSSTLIPTIDGASGNNQGFPNGYTTMDNLSNALHISNKTISYYFDATPSTTNGIKIVCKNNSPFYATFYMGHPIQTEIVDAALRVTTGVQQGNPSSSIVKLKFGDDNSRYKAVYYKDGSYNVFEIIDTKSAYHGIYVYVKCMALTSSSDFDVTEISQLSRETGDVTVIITH